jgi:hypothetical protein
MRTIFKLFVLIVIISSCSKSAPMVFSTNPGNFNFGWEFVKDPAGDVSADLFQKTDDLVSLVCPFVRKGKVFFRSIL